MLKQLFQPLVVWYLATLKTGGYPLIVLLMTMESSFLPLPSEVIIPPAAHLAWAGGGLNFFQFHFSGWPAQIGIVIAGAFGSWLGATIMYWFARIAGRPLILRYGRLVLFPPEKLEKAERWMSHYGPMGVFVARLLPGARQLVGIPAGIAQFNYLKFSIFTLLGATIWCVVLCCVGVKFGNDLQHTANATKTVSLWLGGAMLALGGLYYFFVHRHMAAGKAESGKRKAE
jgi:membrane protein DedA with SNARE-associated domain